MFWQQLINGLMLGSIYALIALGYTMVYGIIKLINFAHGDIYMVGAFTGFFAISVFKLPFVPALILSMVIPSIFGVIIERVAYKPLRNAPRIAALITAIGVSLLLENLGILILSPDPRPFPQIFSGKPLQFFGLTIGWPQITVLITAFALMLILDVFIRHTKLGRAMRAVSKDKDAARLMGINVDRIITLTFAIGSALAGAAGVMVGLIYPSINPLMGIMPGLKAFVAAVLGGIGIIPGAAMGGLIIGVSETMVSAYMYSSWRDAIAFGLLILILLIRPSGLMGRNIREKV